jgi:L-asparaginase II
MSVFEPVFELSRGPVVESVHFGAGAIVAADGRLLASFGDPHALTFLRSTAKPIQALPFVEAGGPAALGFSQKELAFICASHHGTDDHADTAAGIQSRVGFNEADLQCGVHPPEDRATRQRLAARGQAPNINRHNCSGKHSGMLAYAVWQGWDRATYLEPSHPVQKNILRTFSEMCDLPEADVVIGIDGCSAPNFAVPIYNAALALARLADPADLPDKRATACRQISAAMMAHPEMIAGPKGFDTRLMQTLGQAVAAKGGAEGYHGMAVMPGNALGEQGVGIAFKIADGDARGRIRAALALKILQELGLITEQQLSELSDVGPEFTVENWRRINVGQGQPALKLTRHEAAQMHA